MKIKYKKEKEALEHYNNKINYFDRNKFLNAAISYDEFDRLLKKQNNIITNKDNKLTILDFGCGTGETSIYLATKYNNIKRIDAIDYSEKRIEILNKYINENNLSTTINPIQADVNIWLDNILNNNKENIIKYDIIFTFEILEHLSKPYNIMNKLKQLLSNKGLILGTVPLQEKANNIHLSAFKNENIIKNKLKVNIDYDFKCRFDNQRIIYYINSN